MQPRVWGDWVERVDLEVAERGVAGLAATACVRIRDEWGGVVGSGFLVGVDLVATCAHVIAEAVRGDPFAEAAPDRGVAVDFPVSASGPVARNARVHRWVPIAEDGTGDVALLRLDAPAPTGAVMPPVRRVDGLWGHRFRTFGFPEGRTDGVWTTGVIRSEQGTRWFQLQGELGEQPIEGGFSGAPVWDDETWAVVGMTVAADRAPGVTTAYLVPAEQVFGLDPELLPCPYRGLEPFDEEHAEYFFGRDPDVRRLREAVRRWPLTTVIGPSGAGKSSLVHAGLLPGLRADGVRVAEICPRPDTPILLDVATAVLALVDPGSTEARRAQDAARIGRALVEPGGRDAAVGELRTAVRGAVADRLVLVVDQFEELAEATPETARELLEALAGLTEGNQDAALRVVLTARGPALDEVLTPSVAEALGPGTVLVGPLDRARLREVIVRPAERAPGLAFEEGLVDRILDDAGTEPGQLPLVESLLAQLWERREGGTLTRRAYQASGGVAGALAGHAERVVTAAFDTDEDIERLRLLCTRLAVPAGGERFVRAPVRYAELPTTLRAAIPPLAAGRLVVVSGGHGSASTVELAHQSLIEHWPRLRGWLTADREFLAWRAELDTDRRRWEAAGRDDGALPCGAALTTAERWLDGRAEELTDDEIGFVRRGQARRRRELRRRRVVLAVLGVLVVLAGTLTVVAVRGRGELSTQRATANAETLGRAAGADAQRDPVLAAELALSAWRSDPSDPVARGALADEYLALDGVERVVAGGPGEQPVYAITTAGSGPHAMAALNSNSPATDFVPDPTGPDPRRVRLPDPAGATEGLVSPDGRRYLYLSGDHAARLWDIGGGSAPRQLAGPNDGPFLLAGFSPDGSRLGWAARTPSGDLVLTVLDLASGSGQETSARLPGDVSTVRLTRNPDHVLARHGVNTDPNSRVTLWSLSGNAALRVFEPDAAARGATTVRCVPPDPSVPGSRARLVVTDTDTGAIVERPALAPYQGCTDYRVSADGGYALQPLSAGAHARLVWRATELSSGRSYQFTTPPIDTSAWPVGSTPWISMVSRSVGQVAALVVAGPTVLRINTQPEVPADTGAQPPRRFAVAGGAEIVTTAGSGDLAGYDPGSGRALVTRPSELPAGGLVRAPDDLWNLAPGPAGWQLTRYGTPGLVPAPRITLPSYPEAPPAREGVNVEFGRDPGGPARVAFSLAGGVLGAFDATTGQPLGQPVRLARTPTERDWYRTHADLWPRLGHPDQALVYAPGGRIQLWDVPGGRLLTELPITVIGASSIVAQGDRLAALVQPGYIEEWNLATGQRVPGNLAASKVQQLLGFDADGHLIGSYLSPPDWAVIVFYDMARRTEAGELRTAWEGQVTATPTTLRISGEIGYLPTQLASTAGQWRDRLCRLLPGPLSPAARKVLPPGAPTAPCAPG